MLAPRSSIPSPSMSGLRGSSYRHAVSGSRFYNRQNRMTIKRYASAVTALLSSVTRAIGVRAGSNSGHRTHSVDCAANGPRWAAVNAGFTYVYDEDS